MNINIFPKIAEDPNELGTIRDFLKDQLEIQLLSDDVTKFANKIENFLKKHKFKKIIVHLPMSLADWESILMNKEIETQFLAFVRQCTVLTDKYETEIYILGHLSMREIVLKKVQLKEWFGFLIRMVDNSKVYFLVENPTIEPYKAKTAEPFYKFVKSFNNNKVRCCLDLCHYRVMHSLLGDRYKLPEDIAQYVQSVHFSYYDETKHPYDENTHGIRHKNKEDMLEDLNFLKSIGIDISKTFIVTEINEKDYKNKPDLIEELKMITEINCEGNI